MFLLIGFCTTVSDGRPSDFSGNVDEAAKSIVDTVSQLSSQFGRRFTVATIGMGNSGRKDQFDILRNMVSTCSDYGSTGLFQLPNMNSSSLGAAFSSLASSVTNTQREMTHLDFDGAIGRQRQVRQVQRERASTVPFYTEVVEKKKFDIYMHEKVSFIRSGSVLFFSFLSSYDVNFIYRSIEWSKLQCFVCVLDKFFPAYSD